MVLVRGYPKKKAGVGDSRRGGHRVLCFFSFSLLLPPFLPSLSQPCAYVTPFLFRFFSLFFFLLFRRRRLGAWNLVGQRGGFERATFFFVIIPEEQSKAKKQSKTRSNRQSVVS